MEKKTIGKLISALRRAHGMTQKELGEKLFVSDKTVSRWECDECTPELSLIPVIADLFGITSDELLRGECNRSITDEEEPHDAEWEAKRKAQSDRIFRMILHKKKIKYKNLSMISIGIALVGLLVAMICNVSFSRGVLGFCLASVFELAAAICQCCFASGARYVSYDPSDEEEHSEEINRANNTIIRIAVMVLGSLVVLFAFTLPLAVMTYGAYTGLTFDTWLLNGLLFAGAALILVCLLYVFLIRKILLRMSYLTVDENQLGHMKYQRKLLKKMVAITVLFALAFGIADAFAGVHAVEWIVNPIIFDNYDEFVAFMEQGNEQYQDELSFTQTEPDGTYTEEPLRQTETVLDKTGNILCEYPMHPSVVSVQFSFETSENGLPVYVTTRGERQRSYLVVNQISGGVALQCRDRDRCLRGGISVS